MASFSTSIVVFVTACTEQFAQISFNQPHYFFFFSPCQPSSLPLHRYQRSSQRWWETPSTWSAALRAAPTAPWASCWPGPASHLRAGRRSSNRRPPSRPRPSSSWTALTSGWGTRWCKGCRGFNVSFVGSVSGWILVELLFSKMTKGKWGESEN